MFSEVVVVGNIYYRKFYNYIIDNDKMTKLLGSIYFGRDDIMASAVDHGRVRPHQGHRDSTEKLACWLSFVTTLLSGKSLPKSPHHIRCHTMKAPESFYCQRRKLEPLSSARFCSISHFPVISFGECLACSPSCVNVLSEEIASVERGYLYICIYMLTFLK